MSTDRSRLIRSAAPSHRHLGLGAACAIVGLLSCSLIVDSNATQCESSSDCARFPGTVCFSSACVSPPAGECSTTQYCVQQYGEYHLCRKTDGRCVALLSNECATIQGDYTNDSAIVSGWFASGRVKS